MKKHVIPKNSYLSDDTVCYVILFLIFLQYGE